MQRRVGIPPQIRSVIALLLLPLHLAACTSFRAQAGAPRDVVARGPDEARLILVTGDTIGILRPRIAADSIVGFRVVPPAGAVRHGSASATQGGHLAVPLAQVRGIEVREFDEGKTTAYVGTTVVVLGFLAAVAVKELNSF